MDDGDDDGRGKTSTRPAKRPRLKQEIGETTPATKITKCPKERKPPVKRYRAKIRASSPTSRLEKSKVDFDAFPSAVKTVTTRMKGKNGKIAPVKLKPVKPRPVGKENKAADISKVARVSSDAPQLPKVWPMYSG